MEIKNLDLAEAQLKEVRDAANEGLDNLATLREEGFEGGVSEQTIDYLRGDAYELEQRTGRACQTIEAVTSEAEAEREDGDE